VDDVYELASYHSRAIFTGNALIYDSCFFTHIKVIFQNWEIVHVLSLQAWISDTICGLE
jgi:hypothetical protein